VTDIIAAELKRFAWRRSFRACGILALCGIAVLAVIVFVRSDRSVSGAATVQPSRRIFVEDCVRSFEGAGEEVPPGFRSIREFCRAQAVPLVVERDSRFHFTSMEDVFKGTSVPLIILGLALGASFIGAEWHVGTITTLLTWETRRVRVMVGKVLALALAVFTSAVVLQVVLGLSLWPAAAFRGTTQGVDVAWLADTMGVVARGALIAALAAALGFAIASVARNTTTALVIGFAYFAVVEALLRGLRPNWQQWLIGDNAAAFVTADPESVFMAGGRGALASLLVVAGYAVGLTALATVWFRARDVT
jgi:hypothetical protein